MSSKPQAFANIKDWISFETSQSRKLTGLSIDGSQHGFDLSLHMPMVTVTQVIRFEPVSKQSTIMLALSIE
jgi:hypothetical protein